MGKKDNARPNARAPVIFQCPCAEIILSLPCFSEEVKKIMTVMFFDDIIRHAEVFIN